MITSEKKKGQMITNINSLKKKYKILIPTENIKARLEFINMQHKAMRYHFGNTSGKTNL